MNLDLFGSIKSAINSIIYFDRDVHKILRFWFDSKFGPFRPEWFDRSIDDAILEDYSCIVEKLVKGDIEHWKTTKYGRLAYLIVSDQFSRNIKRHCEIDSAECDKKALELALDMLYCRNDLEYRTMTERMFILLPLRHTKNNKYIRRVLELLEEYRKNMNESNRLKKISQLELDLPFEVEYGHCRDVLEKFRMATIKNLTENEDENIVVAPLSIVTHSNEKLTIATHSNEKLTIKLDKYTDVLDLDYGVREKLLEKPANLLESVKKYVDESGYRRLGVSLSGGIDSMVVLDILIRLLGKENVVALHIAHSNREIAKKELDFIKEWCCYHEVVLVYRDVNYMNRESIDRNFYEDESKKLRFSLYRTSVSKYCLDGVCLGHHRDDIGENVMMNILQSRDVVDLKGMEKNKEMFGVNIIRPLLDVKKNVVWTYGFMHQIQCFKDSTPDWSWRGVLRRQIYPKLNERVGDIHDILAKLGDKSEDWNIITQKLVFEPLYKKIEYYKYGCILQLEESHLEMPNSFFTRVLLEVCSKMGVRMITEKNQRGFIEWLRDTSLDKKYQLSNGYMAIKQNQKEIYLVKDEILDKKKWSYKISYETPKEQKRDTFSLKDLVKGEFRFTEEYTEAQRIKEVNSFEKGDKNRKLYGSFGGVLPKITSGRMINSEKMAEILIFVE